jgi:hypothetical protein
MAHLLCALLTITLSGEPFLFHHGFGDASRGDHLDPTAHRLRGYRGSIFLLVFFLKLNIITEQVSRGKWFVQKL